jgi:pantothenate kinase
MSSTAEISYNPPIGALAARIRSLASANDGRIILGIAGSPGSGKSTLARSLATQLGAIAVAVPMDGFHLANISLTALGRRNRKGAVDTFDAWGYVALLNRILQERAHEVYAPSFDRAVGEPIAAEVVVKPDHKVIITEGNYLLLDAAPWNRVPTLTREIWFCEAPAEERRHRLIQRHQQHGRTLAEATSWADQVDAANAEVIQATRERADLIVHTASA